MGVVEASMEASGFCFFVEASISSMKAFLEASMAFMEAFMEAMEALTSTQKTCSAVDRHPRAGLCSAGIQQSLGRPT